MDEYIRKQNEKNKSAAMGGFEEVSREREAAYKTAEQKSGEGFAELLRQMYADDYRRRAETDASLEARGLNTGAGSQASLEQASTLRQNERDMRLAEESARLNIETSRNAAEAEARAAVQKAIASADYNAANQLYENFKSERSSAQRQVDKLLAAGVMPDDGTISKSGYDLDYVKGLYTKNTASRGGSGKSTFESIAEKAGQTIAAALKNPKGGNGSNKKGGTAATLILNNAMQKKDVNERQEYLLAAQAAGAITDKECGGMLLLTMQAPTFAKPKVTALQLGAIEGKEPIDRSEALKLKTAIFGNSPVALPTTVGEAKTMLTNAVVGSLAAEITARRKQSENMSAYLNAVYDDSAPTTSVQLKTQLDSGEITQDEIIARHAAAADYREKHFLTSTDGATVEDLFMQGYTEEQVDQYLTTRSKEQETADNEKAMSNVQPHSFLDYDSDVENVIAGILARGRALWNNFLGNISGEGETRNEHEAWLGLHPYDEEAQAEQEAAQQRKKQEYYNFADYLSSQSAAYLDAAKEGKGALGEFAVDAAVVLSDVATDVAANFLVPGSGIVLMGVRAYEQGRMTGRQNGLDDGEQILYGLSTAGIEITTEKLFGGLKIAYGKGVADKAAGKAIAKITERLAETSAGKAVSKFASSGTGKVIAAAFGEGMEEVIADLLQPGVDVAFGLSEEYEVHLEDIVYDGLLGGFVGLLGGGTNLAQNRLAQRAAETQTTYNTLAQGGVTAEQQWATMRSQDPSLSGALFSANNGAALMAEFERVKHGAKSGIAFAFNSIQQTGAVNTNEAEVTAAARSATEVGVVTEQDESTDESTVVNTSTAQAEREPDPQQVSPEYAAALEAEQQYREGFNEGVGTPRSGFGSVREQSPEMAAWYRMADEEGESGYHPLTENRLDTLQASQLAQGKTELREGIQVPKKDIFGGFTSQTVSNLVNSGITPDAVADSIMEDARTGKLSHIVITDNEAKLKAEADIESLGWDKALEEFKADVEKGITGKHIVTTGLLLYNNAVTAGDFKTALDITALLVKCSTNTAQALQAMSMLEKLSPDSRLYAAFKGIDTITKEIVKKYHLEEGITIDPSLISEYREALINGDNEAIRKAWGEIEKNIALQIPPSWIDKFNAWRYLSMLGNPRTHIRNIFGNTGFAVVRLPKDVLATGLEYIGSAVSGGKMQRTKAFLNPATNVADRQLIATAWLDYANAQATIIGSGTKYNDLANTIDEKRTIFTSKVGSVVEAASKGNTKLLNFEDRWFSQPAYTLALAGYLKANGISATEYTSGDANPEVISKAQEYAIREAQKATYRDTNAFSQAISRMRVKPASADASAGEKALRGVGTVLVEGILPYKKTPANIFVRAAEYSPAGLTKYLLYGTVQLARGKMSAAHWIDGLSAGLTGTGLVALGVWLAAEGILMGGEPDDREKLQRYQGYSINLGGKSYTLDWLAPEALPVFVGVELYNQHKAGNGNNAWALIESMKNLAEPVTEMSMLQGVNDMLETVSYADDKLSAIAVQSAVSYISQFIPTLSGQIERITEDRRQTTFVDRNSETPTDVQRILGKLFNKLPGEYQQIDYVDAWGRTQETGNAFERLANNLINPAYVNEIQVEKVEDELQRLTDLGESGMFPSRPAMSDQINGEYLTAEQYEKYTKTAGQLKLAVVSDLTSSEVYAKLSDADKAEVIRKAYTYANGVAKLEIDEDAEVASWIIKAKDYGNPSAFLLAKHTLSDIEYEKGEQGAKKEAIAKAINAMPLSRSEKSKLFELLYPTYKNDIEWR